MNKKEDTRIRRRKQILEAAIHLWYKHGMTETTMEQIASAVGITQAGLYRFIKSKYELVRMFVEYSTEFDISLLVYRNSLNDISHAEILRKCAKRWITLNKTQAEKAVILERETVHFTPEIKQLLFDSARDVTRFFEILLIDGVKAGEFEIGNIELTAFNIVTFGSQYAMRWWALRDLFTPEEYASLQTEAILKQILVDKKGNEKS